MNKDELKLHIELVPQSLWYLNPRTAMGPVATTSEHPSFR